MGRRVKLTNLETGETTEFKSMYAAGKHLGVNPGRISSLDGKTGKIGGVSYHVEVEGKGVPETSTLC